MQPFKKSIFRDYFETILIGLLALTFAKTFVFQQFKIPTSSMEDSLLIGDHLAVNKFMFGSVSFAWEKNIFPQRNISRGGVIVFRFPQNTDVAFIKRVIGMPGDTIEVIDKQVYVNGKALNEPYKVHKDPFTIYRDGMLKKRDNFGPVVVPEGQFFAMGDNRDNSDDSRFWGYVPREYIRGRACVIWWSYPDAPGEYKKTGLVHFVVDVAKKIATFGSRSRWKRFFLVVR